MGDYPTDLSKNKLEDTEEITVIYEGPSFENKMEIGDLRVQLKSTESLIKDLVDELYKNKEISINSNNIKIYVKLERSSFQEIISIVLSNPIVSGIISGCVVALVNHLLNKENNPSIKNKIENMTNNFYIIENVNYVVSPLHQRGDKLKISFASDPNINTEVIFEHKHLIDEHLKQLNKGAIFETFEEEFFGYLSRVNIDKNNFGFTLEGSNKHIPVTFESCLNLTDIKNILGERVKIKARVTYKNTELYKLEIKEYELKKIKSLNDYF